jgi:hypothetical protein
MINLPFGSAPTPAGWAESPNSLAQGNALRKEHAHNPASPERAQPLAQGDNAPASSLLPQSLLFHKLGTPLPDTKLNLFGKHLISQSVTNPRKTCNKMDKDLGRFITWQNARRPYLCPVVISQILSF